MDGDVVDPSPSLCTRGQAARPFRRQEYAATRSTAATSELGSRPLSRAGRLAGGGDGGQIMQREATLSAELNSSLASASVSLPLRQRLLQSFSESEKMLYIKRRRSET